MLPVAGDGTKDINSDTNKDSVASATHNTDSTDSSSTNDSYQTSLLPFTILNVTGLFLIAILMVIATLGGVGGTSSLFPIILIFFQFSPSSAVAHNTLFSFFSVIGRLVLEIVQGIRKKEERRINFHLAFLAFPSIAIGSIIGVNLSYIAP